MTRTVVALYDNFQDANAAVRELVDNGFTRDDISLMAGDQSGEYGRYLESDEYRNRDMNADVSGASSGAGVGASIGATLGGIGGLLV
ncbi:MAG TPA: general stress protein, partial [Anaerolineaceae bacterium]